jgi:hypothetical protein
MESGLEGGSGYDVQEGCLPLRWDGAISKGFNCKLHAVFYAESEAI